VWTTNIASGSLVMFLGDGIAQCDAIKSQGVGEFDWVRSSVMVSWAAMSDVPINLALFALVRRTWGALGLSTRPSLVRSALQAACFFVPGALVRNPAFIAYCTTLEHAACNLVERRPVGEGWDLCMSRVRTKMREDLLTIVSSSASLWLPVNTFTFYAVPARFRALWTSSVAVCWLTYLSMIQHKAEHGPVST